MKKSLTTSIHTLLRELPRLFAELRKRGILPGTARSVSKSSDPKIELALLPNAELRVLKKKYLKKDVEIVDVLAFPNGDFPVSNVSRASKKDVRKKMGDQTYLGEVYINEDIARTDKQRARFLLVHGILHLLGYRHGTKRDTIVMEQLEKDILHDLWDQTLLLD